MKVSVEVPSIRRPSSAITIPAMHIRMICFAIRRLLAHDRRSSPVLPSRDIWKDLVDQLL